MAFSLLLKGSGSKVAEIYNRYNLDVSMTGLVCYFIQEYGWKGCAKFTDDDIANAKVPNLFAEWLYRNIIKVARDICKECDYLNDYIPFVAKSGQGGCNNDVVEFSRGMFADRDAWESFVEKMASVSTIEFAVDEDWDENSEEFAYERINSIRVFCMVEDVIYKS